MRWRKYVTDNIRYQPESKCSDLGWDGKHVGGCDGGDDGGDDSGDDGGGGGGGDNKDGEEEKIINAMNYVSDN